ncbi:MAG: hypothetical protein CFE44_21620 [Burkholderiales bacterium PBB4]|nr:MAG: hypothetical protein CFE44_21620 [Burkholderiales bacterium PBB4]
MGAKRALLFARNSYISEARVAAQALREKNTNYDPRLSAWIMLLEGVIQHFESLDNTKSKDKFVRAYLIGQVAKDRELAGLAAAWLSHSLYVAGNVAACVEHLIQAFEWSVEDEHETRGRAFMVLAGIYDWIDDAKAAKFYLALAREHASKSGDLALQNAVLFNAAAYAEARLTRDDCAGIATPEAIRIATLHVKSAHNLNSALGIETLQSMIPIMNAEIATAKGEWGAAVHLFDSHIDSFVKDGQARLTGKLYAQRAWCKSNLKDLAGAQADLEYSLRESVGTVDFDDLAIMRCRLASVYQTIGDQNQAEVQRGLARSALDALGNQQAAARLALQAVEFNLPKK